MVSLIISAVIGTIYLDTYTSLKIVLIILALLVMHDTIYILINVEEQSELERRPGGSKDRTKDGRIRWQ